jgi:hypothetical protein
VPMAHQAHLLASSDTRGTVAKPPNSRTALTVSRTVTKPSLRQEPAYEKVQFIASRRVLFADFSGKTDNSGTMSALGHASQRECWARTRRMYKYAKSV